MRPKLYPCFYVEFLLIVLRKNITQSLAAIWLDFAKLQSYKVSHSAYVTSSHECTKHIAPIFFAFFVTFTEKEPRIKFYGVFNHFQKLVKSQTIKLYLSVSDVIHGNKQNILIVASMQTFGNFCKCHFVSWWKRIILSKSCYFGLRSPFTNERFDEC